MSKVRDMVRSILPSTRRKGAKWRKNSIKRRGRRNAKQALLSDDPDTFWLSDLTGKEFGWGAMHHVVSERREADKLAHFQRWAAKITENMNHKERLGYMRGILPVGVIGDHALEHLQRMGEFKDPDDYTYGFRTWEEQSKEERRQQDLRRRRVLRRLRSSVLNGDHKLINNIAKLLEIEPCRGPADVADFHKRARKAWKWEEVEEEIDKSVPLRKIYNRIRKEQMRLLGWG